MSDLRIVKGTKTRIQEETLDPNTFYVADLEFEGNKYLGTNEFGDTVEKDLPILQGATTSAPGAAGIVPAPTTADTNKFLRGDGTWAAGGNQPQVDNITIKYNSSNKLEAQLMKGATTSADGTAGIVKPTKTDVHKFLSGDGTWKATEVKAEKGVEYSSSRLIPLDPISGDETYDQLAPVKGVNVNGWTTIDADRSKGDMTVYFTFTPNDSTNDNEQWMFSLNKSDDTSSTVGVSFKEKSGYIYVKNYETNIATYSFNNTTKSIFKIVISSTTCSVYQDNKLLGTAANISSLDAGSKAISYFRRSGASKLAVNADMSFYGAEYTNKNSVRGCITPVKRSNSIYTVAFNKSSGAQLNATQFNPTNGGTLSEKSKEELALKGVVFGGATSTTAGTMGMVPAPATTDTTKYLRGDGTWAAFTAGTVTIDNTTIVKNASAELMVPYMQGATETGNGSFGLVPGPTTADTNKFLRGDGTWAEAPAVTLPDTSNSNELKFLGSDMNWYTIDELVELYK